MAIVPKILPRRLWGALAARYAYSRPVATVEEVILHHGASPTPTDRTDADNDGAPDAEEATMRQYQQYHMGTKNWSDIAYNFGSGDSGHTYEGRGWERQGGATGYPYDRRSISIVALGNFDVHEPSQAMLEGIAGLILEGMALGWISPTATIKGHRDYKSTNCPGSKLQAQLPTIRALVAAGEITMKGVPTDKLWMETARDAEDGDKNEAIRIWQFALVEWGQLDLPHVTGVKDVRTREAHRSWEQIMRYPDANDKPGKVSWPKLLSGPGNHVVRADVSTLRTYVNRILAAANGLMDEADRVDG